MQSITGIILAAGRGKRMGSPLPKVLHPVGQTPMVEYVRRALVAAGLSRMAIVIGPDEAPFHSFLQQYTEIAVCIQQERNGTAGAVASCVPLFPGMAVSPYVTPLLRRGTPEASDYVLICNGDMPGVSGKDLHVFVRTALQACADVALLGFSPPSPYGYGRILCGPEGHFQ